MDIRQIRVFKSIFDTGSIVGAAERERSAPSVLAHHLSNLEDRLGTALFERRSRGVVPTEAGRRFHAHVVSILRAIDIAEADMRDTSSMLEGRVVLGLAFSAVLGIARPLMRIVLEEHPGLQLEIAESVSGATVERLLAAEIDLALAYNPSRDARLTSQALLEEDMICLGRRDVLEEPGAPLTFDAFLGKPFVLARKSAHGRSLPDSTDLQKRLEHHARVFSENVAAATHFIDAGLGVMLGTQLYLDHGVFREDIVSRPIVGPTVTRSLYLCERKDSPSSRATAFVRQLLVDLVRREIGESRWACRSLLHGPGDA